MNIYFHKLLQNTAVEIAALNILTNKQQALEAVSTLWSFVCNICHIMTTEN
jgi:hypothetical protein